MRVCSLRNSPRGILQTEKTGDELFQPIIEDLTGPIEKIVNRQVDVTLANMNPEEVMAYEEGDTMGIEKLTPDDVRGLRFKATVELTTPQESTDPTVLRSGLRHSQEKFYMLPPDRPNEGG